MPFPWSEGAHGPFQDPGTETPTVKGAYRNTYWVDGTFGADGNPGLSVNTAFATIQKALNTVQDQDTIIVMRSSYDEQLTTGTVIGTSDMVPGRGRYVSLIGASPGVYPYDAPQLYNVSGDTTTIELRSPGWRVSGFRIISDTGSPRGMNIWWVGSSGTAGNNWAPGAQVDHCVFYGAVANGSGLNIQGVPDVRILDNIFELFPTAALPALESVGTATAPTNRASFLRNQFLDNVENMDIALNASNVKDNVFGGNHVNAMTIGLDLRNGNDNIVFGNSFAGDYAIRDTGNYAAGSGDNWLGNTAFDVADGNVNAAGQTLAIPS